MPLTPTPGWWATEDDDARVTYRLLLHGYWWIRFSNGLWIALQMDEAHVPELGQPMVVARSDDGRQVYVHWPMGERVYILPFRIGFFCLQEEQAQEEEIKA